MPRTGQLLFAILFCVWFLICFPPLAALPARALGLLLRFVAQRINAVVFIFKEALLQELGSIGGDIGSWLDSMLWPSHDLGPVAASSGFPGQRALTTIVLFSLGGRMLRAF
jgi:hypothetical protein